MLVIWKSDVVFGMAGKALRPKVQYDNNNSTSQMPYLDIDSVSCNCWRWPKRGMILFTSTSADKSISSKDLDEKMNVMVKTKYQMKLMTRRYPSWKWDKVIQGKISKKEELDVKIVEQPVNVQNENALIVKVLINAMYEPVGYVPGKKVHKFTVLSSTKSWDTIIIIKASSSNLHPCHQWLYVVWIYACHQERQVVTWQ